MLRSLKLRTGVAATLLALGVTLLPVLTSSSQARQERDPNSGLSQARHGDDDPPGDDHGGRGGDDGPGDDRGGGGGRGNGGNGGGGSRARVRKDFRLLPTGVAPDPRLKGNARVEARDGREKIKVEVESRTLPAGTEFEVYAVNGGETIFLGILTLGVGDDSPRAGEIAGEIEVKNWDGGTLPTGASPVSTITEIFVTDPASDEVLLRSRFRR